MLYKVCSMLRFDHGRVSVQLRYALDVNQEVPLQLLQLVQRHRRTLPPDLRARHRVRRPLASDERRTLFVYAVHERGPLVPVTGLLDRPDPERLLSPFLAARLKGHLERVGLDDEEGVGLVEGYRNLGPGKGVLLRPEVEGPG